MPENEILGKELSKLFETIPPNQLRKAFQEVFYGYVMSRSRIGVWPLNFPEIVEGFYLFSVMLDRLEED